MNMSTGFLRSRKRGFILLSVLMVSMFLISASFGFAWFVRDQVKRVQIERFELESRGVAYLAVLNVFKGLKADKNSYDSVHERWFGEHIIPIGESMIVFTSILPLNDKIPLNELFLPDGNTIRGEIIQTWDNIWDIVDSPGMAQAALDLMDKNKTARIGGYERNYFPNRPLLSVSELKLLDDLKWSQLAGGDGKEGLYTYLTRWCGRKINVNTASLKVLSVIEGIDEVTAQEIVEERRARPFKDLESLSHITGFSGTLGPKLTNLLDTKSDFFLLDLNVSSLGTDLSKRYRVIVSKEAILKWEEL